VTAFLGGAFIKLFDYVGDPTAERPLVITLVLFNFGMLILYTALASYQFTQSDVLPNIRLVSTRQVPQLNMEKQHVYHLFLSHVYAEPTTPLPAAPVSAADAQCVQCSAGAAGKTRWRQSSGSCYCFCPTSR